MIKAQESDLAKEEETDQTFEAGNKVATAAPAAPTGNGATAPATAPANAATSETQGEGTKRKADEKEGVEGDAKKPKA